MMSKQAYSPHKPPPPRVKYHTSGADEILRPALMTVSDGRCYRKLTDVAFGPRTTGTERGLHLTTDTTETTSTTCEDPVTRQPLYTDDVYDEGEDMTEEIEGLEQTPNGGYTLRLSIPPVFFKYIIGQGGKTKSTVEKDTKCKIRVPGRGKSGDIVVEGQTVTSVADAKRRLEMIAWNNRNKEPITHFLSIPLNVKNVQDKFNQFKQEVLLSCKDKESIICNDLFQVEEKLHLTVGVMRLFSEDEVTKAKELFRDCVMEARVHLGSKPAVISLKGVECLKDDPSAVDVLYAHVSLTDSSDRLQAFVDAVVHQFREKAPELMPLEFEREGVKLHVTLMNSSFLLAAESASVYKGEGGRLPKAVRQYLKKKPFDATKIFKDFGDFDFGEVPLEVVHLSQRGEVGPDGYYRCIDKISLTSQPH